MRRSLFGHTGVFAKMLARSLAMITLAILAVEAISYRLSSQEIEKLTRERQATLVETYSERLESSFRFIHAELGGLVDLPSVQDYYLNLQFQLENEARENLNATKTVFEQLMKRNPSIRLLRMVTAQGRPLIEVGELGLAHSKGEVIKDDHPKEGSAEIRFAGLMTHNNEESSLLFYAPLFHRQRPVGYLELFYGLGDVTAKIRSERLFQTGHMGVLDLAGQVVYFPGSRTGEQLASRYEKLTGYLQQMKTSERGNIHLDMDQEYVTEYALVKGLRWILVAMAPADEMFATLNRIRRIVYVVVAINILIEILFLAYFMRVIILKPLREILQATQRILGGDLSARAMQRSEDEIGELAETFNRMTESLQKSIEQVQALNARLELRVIERTQDLQKANLELENNLRVTQQIQGKLIESSKMAALGEMAGGIAHEINTPLGVMSLSMGNIEDLLEGPTIDKVAISQAMQRNMRMIDRITKIISGLRTFARGGEGDPMVEAPIDVLVDDALMFCREKFRNSVVEVDSSGVEKNLVVRCRPTQIVQVLLNLLSNSFDSVSSSSDKWIRLTAGKRGSNVEIRVFDSGPGVSSEVRNRIFDPFFTTKEVGKGTGLGLSISKTIMESHGGSLALDLDQTSTCFLIKLPLSQEVKPWSLPEIS